MKTVLNYPVELIPGQPEPNLMELIARYYYEHLSPEEAYTASIEYVQQINDAERALKVDFTKFVMSRFDLPEGLSTDDLISGAARKVRAEQAAADAEAEREELETVVGGDPNEPTFDDAGDDPVKVHVLVFDTPAEMQAFLDKTIAAAKRDENE